MKLDNNNLEKYKQQFESKGIDFWTRKLRTLRDVEWLVTKYIFDNCKVTRYKFWRGELSLRDGLDKFTSDLLYKNKNKVFGYENLKYNRDEWYKNTVNKWDFLKKSYPSHKRPKFKDLAYLAIDVFYSKFPDGEPVRESIKNYSYKNESNRTKLNELFQKYYEPMAKIQDQILDYFDLVHELSPDDSKKLAALEKEYEELEERTLSIHETARNLLDEEKNHLLNSIPGSENSHRMFDQLEMLYGKRGNYISFDESLHVKEDVVLALNEMFFFLFSSINQELGDDALGETDHIKGQLDLILSLLNKNKEFLKNYYKEFGSNSMTTKEEKDSNKLSLDDR